MAPNKKFTLTKKIPFRLIILAIITLLAIGGASAYISLYSQRSKAMLPEESAGGGGGGGGTTNEEVKEDQADDALDETLGLPPDQTKEGTNENSNPNENTNPDPPDEETNSGGDQNQALLNAQAEMQQVQEQLSLISNMLKKLNEMSNSVIRNIAN